MPAQQSRGGSSTVAATPPRQLLHTACASLPPLLNEEGSWSCLTLRVRMRIRLMNKCCHAVPITIGIVSASHPVRLLSRKLSGCARSDISVVFCIIKSKLKTINPKQKTAHCHWLLNKNKPWFFGSLASRQKNRKMNWKCIFILVPYFSLPLQRKVTKEKSPSLRNFLPYQAKTALSAPRRYRSCPSELPVSILNRGIFDCVQPFGYV